MLLLARVHCRILCLCRVSHVARVFVSRFFVRTSRAVRGNVQVIARCPHSSRTPSPSRHCRPLKAALSCNHTSAWRAAVLTSHSSGRLRRRLTPALGINETFRRIPNQQFGRPHIKHDGCHSICDHRWGRCCSSLSPKLWRDYQRYDRLAFNALKCSWKITAWRMIPMGTCLRSSGGKPCPQGWWP